MLADFHRLEIPLVSSLDVSKDSTPSLSALTLDRRLELDEHIKSGVEQLTHNRSDTILEAAVSRLRQERSDLKSCLSQLRNNEITTVAQIIGSTEGSFAQLSSVMGKGVYNEMGYSNLCGLVAAVIPQSERKGMYLGTQRSLGDYYPHRHGKAPMPEASQPTKSRTERWLEGNPRSAAGGADSDDDDPNEIVVDERRGNAQYQPYRDERIA